MNAKKQTIYLVQGAIIAAIYAAVTYVAASIGLAYGPVQFRFSEALTILPVFTPAAIPGLTIGCFLGNLGSPFGMTDVVLGTLASLLAALLSRAFKKVTVKGFPILAPLFPVITNAIIIGLEIAYFLPEGFTVTGFLISALWVGIGELVICYGLGFPLWVALNKIDLFKKFLNAAK